MEKKCGNCKFWKKLTSGSPGRNHGKCRYLDDVELPAWAEGEYFILEGRGGKCRVFEQKGE